MSIFRSVMCFGLLMGLLLQPSGCGRKLAKTCLRVDECASEGPEYTCRDNQCLPKTEEEKQKEKENAQCPSLCTQDAECAKCPDGKTACERGTCRVPTPTAPINGKCGPNGQKCAQDANCIVLSQGAAHGYCLRKCDSKTTACDSDRGTCRALSNGEGACIPKGTLDKGAACVYDPDADKIDPAKACKRGLVCIDQRCAEPALKNKYHQCTELDTCGDKARCTLLQSGMKYGYCLPECDPKTPSCDADAGTCQKLSDTAGVCFPKGTAKENAPCGLPLDAPTVDPNVLCAEGLRCFEKKCFKPETVGIDATCNHLRVCDKGLTCVFLAATDTDGICLPTVTECKSGACAAGRTCIARSSGNALCLKACTDPNACPTGTSCNNQQPPVCVPASKSPEP